MRYRMENVMYTVRTKALGTFRQNLIEEERVHLRVVTRLKHHWSASEKSTTLSRHPLMRRLAPETQ